MGLTEERAIAVQRQNNMVVAAAGERLYGLAAYYATIAATPILAGENQFQQDQDLNYGIRVFGARRVPITRGNKTRSSIGPHHEKRSFRSKKSRLERCY